LQGSGLELKSMRGATAEAGDNIGSPSCKGADDREGLKYIVYILVTNETKSILYTFTQMMH